MTRFSVPWGNSDLDIHPDPQPGWDRVALVGLWQDAKKLRKAWPEAAVCGPLRTLRGIDLLIRSLLANPQIRVLVVTGRDLSPEQGVQKALETAWALWSTKTHGPVAADLNLHAYLVAQGVDLIDMPMHAAADLDLADLTHDRPGGAIILPPPPPPENPELPAGLPGQQIIGHTLADVWPKVLHEVVRFGNQVPTSYGGSRELLSLISVIEDPKGSLALIEHGHDLANLHKWEAPAENDVQRAFKHPILGISQADLDDYYTKSFMGEVPPAGVSYSYGSRLHGVGPGLYTMTQMHTDQLAAVRKLLREAPGTRTAYLTPWRPDEDCGKESGRPCLVGAWFRAVDGKLHLTVTFRSHDMHGAYPLNLAACCRWLCEEAEALGMEVGTVTCVSMSAHVYEHALEAASKVVEQHVKATWSQDSRSAWRVWCEGVHAPQPDPEDPWAVLAAWRDSNAEPWLAAGQRVCGAFHAVSGVYVNVYGRKCYAPTELDRDFTESEALSICKLVKAELADGLPPVPTRVVGYTYYAEATDPAGTRVLAVFEAPTKERLIRDIQASGLVTSVQHALWLGAEVGRL